MAITGCAAPPTAITSDGGDAAKDASEPQDGSPFADTSFDAPSKETCTDATKSLIYVVSEEADLYGFAPSTSTISKVAHLACKPPGGAESMAVDRSGTAWVNYADGRIYRASVIDGSCVDSGWIPPDGGYGKFGMAFSLDAPDAGSETLFLFDNGLARQGLVDMDTSTLAIHEIGPLGTPYTLDVPAELTGTGDGKLYAFLPTASAIAELDKSTAAVLSHVSVPFAQVSAFAFAFWGGSFYLFTAAGGPSEIRAFDPVTKTIAMVNPNVGFTIVGAGVSTCAPFTPPN